MQAKCTLLELRATFSDLLGHSIEGAPDLRHFILSV